MQIMFGPPTKGDIEAIEKIQKRATKLVISLRKLPYKERLQHLNLYTLKYRRLRGDMVEVFKILHHMYDSSVAPDLIRNTSATRGNKYKLLNHTFHYNFRKFSFAARIVNIIWNSLPAVASRPLGQVGPWPDLKYAKSGQIRTGQVRPGQVHILDTCLCCITCFRNQTLSTSVIGLIIGWGTAWLRPEAVSWNSGQDAL